MSELMARDPLPVGQAASLAFLWEATASKPGNVHRGSDFDGLTFVDLATSGLLVGPILDRAGSRRLGPTLLEAVDVTARSVGTNTNLGGLLLIAPLAMVPQGAGLRSGVEQVLASLNAEDARLAYEAIRRAKAGGLGQVAEADVAGPAPSDLIAAMRLAADRDLIARQYTNGFAEVFERSLASLEAGLARGWALGDTIIRTHLELLSTLPDSLIARKSGQATAEQAADYAAQTLRAGEPGDTNYHEALADLDFWLRADETRRNPGTTADLVAAGLFAALRSGIIKLPVRFYA